MTDEISTDGIKDIIEDNNYSESKLKRSLKNNPQFKEFSKTIGFIEFIIIAVGFIFLGYIFYVTDTLGILSIVFLIIMYFNSIIMSSSVDIVIQATDDFEKKFSFEKTKEKINTSDQGLFVLNILKKVLLKWKVLWLLYFAIMAVFYIVAFYIGLFSTILLFCSILFVAVYFYPKIQKNIKSYLKNKSKLIPADPPNIGIMTFFGKPIFNLLLDAGYALILDPFFNFILIAVHQEPEDFDSMTGFITKDNIPVELRKVQVLYIPDEVRLDQFVKAKKQTGIRDAFDSIISNVLKDEIRAKKFEDILSNKGQLENKVKEELTGRGIDDNKNKEMRRNGISDDHLLGINIFRFNIGTIETTPEYTEEMLKKATEERQKEAEIIEVSTEIQQAKLLFEAFHNAGDSKSYSYCIAMVRDDKISREGNFIIPGLRDALSQNVLDTLFKALGGGKKND